MKHQVHWHWAHLFLTKGPSVSDLSSLRVTRRGWALPWGHTPKAQGRRKGCGKESKVAKSDPTHPFVQTKSLTK